MLYEKGYAIYHHYCKTMFWFGVTNIYVHRAWVSQFATYIIFTYFVQVRNFLCFEGRSWWHKQTKIITLNWFENELRMITTKISPQNYRNLYCLHQQCNFLSFSLLLNTKAISIMRRQIILLSLFGRFF